MNEQMQAAEVVWSSVELGQPPEDTLRQQAFMILSRLQSGTENVVRLDAALAAVAAERERMLELLQTARADASREGCPEAEHWLADLARRIGA